MNSLPLADQRFQKSRIAVIRLSSDANWSCKNHSAPGLGHPRWSPDPSEQAAVAVEGGRADEQRNVFAIPGSDSGDSGREGRLVSIRPMPLALRSSWSFSFRIGALLDALQVELLVGALEFFFQQRIWASMRFAGGLGGHRQPVAAFDRVVWRTSRWREVGALRSGVTTSGKGSSSGRVTSAKSPKQPHRCCGLGPFSGGFSEVSDLAWVDHDRRQIGTHQSARDLAFIATVGFEHDQVGSILARHLTKALIPALSLAKDFFSPMGRLSTSSCVLDTSMPTKIRETSVMPCSLIFNVLQLRLNLASVAACLPRRCSRFWGPDGTTHPTKRSPTSSGRTACPILFRIN